MSDCRNPVEGELIAVVSNLLDRCALGSSGRHVPRVSSLRWVAVAACFMVLSLLFGSGASAGEASALLTKYCAGCHNAEKKKGDLDLSIFGNLQNVEANIEFWQTALQQVEDAEMPPEDPLPSDAERAELVAYFRSAIESVDWSKHQGVEHITLPRLTKAEYGNTLRDLLGIDFRAEQMLLDDGQGGSGFSNDRDSLFISPALAEQWFDAADFVVGCLVALEQPPQVKHFEAEDMLMTEKGTMPQNLPGGGFGYSLAGAGQRTLYDELVIPADGWYRVTVRVVGINGDSGMRLRIDGEPVADVKCIDEQPKVETLELLLRAGIHQATWNIEVPTAVKPLPRLTRKQKEMLVTPRTKDLPDRKLPEDAPTLVLAAATKNAPAFPIPEGAAPDLVNTIDRLNRAYVAMQTRIEYMRLVTPEGNPADLQNFYHLLPERIQDMFHIKCSVAELLNVTIEEIDRQLIEANREKIDSNQEVLAKSLPIIGLQYDPAFLLSEDSKRIGAPGVDWMAIEGPIAPANSQKRSIFKDNAEEALAESLPLIFRRPVNNEEKTKYLGLYQAARNRGDNHNEALKVAYVAALTSPNFLFRDEVRGGELNDFQLANRLSYFLWLSMPDDELRSLASQGKLCDEATLRGQVRRMLADPKSRAFMTSFLGQWLGFNAIGGEHVPDAAKFADFTPGLSDAMKLEPVLVFEDIVRSRGSLIRLLDGRDTFANSELAALYEIAGIEGDEMKRVQYVDENRAGLLGMAAILTTSATPNRTSPVTRGKWVLENLLGRRLAEPPADAGQLDDKAGERGKTLREELALHRRNETCAGCHDKIDPIGFGLENFDAIGRFRTEEAGRPVDSSGELPGGWKFSGPAELRELLITRHQDEFVRNLTRRLVAFALGRALVVQDEGLIRQLVDESKQNSYQADRLVESIVLSNAFRNQGPATE